MTGRRGHQSGSLRCRCHLAGQTVEDPMEVPPWTEWDWSRRAPRQIRSPQRRRLRAEGQARTRGRESVGTSWVCVTKWLRCHYPHRPSTGIGDQRARNELDQESPDPHPSPGTCPFSQLRAAGAEQIPLASPRRRAWGTFEARLVAHNAQLRASLGLVDERGGPVGRGECSSATRHWPLPTPEDGNRRPTCRPL